MAANKRPLWPTCRREKKSSVGEVRGWLLYRGIPPEQAGRVTLADYHHARKAEEAEQRAHMELVRWQTYIIGRWLGASINTPQDLFTLPGEVRSGSIPEETLKKLYKIDG